MKASSTLPRDAVALLAPPPLQSPVLDSRVLRQFGLPSETCQDDFVGGGEVVQDLQFLECKPPRDDQNAQRDEQDDEHREADGPQRVRDGDTCGDADQLQPDVEADLALPDLEKRLVARDEALLALQEDDLVEDAIGLDGTPLGGQPSARPTTRLKKGGKGGMGGSVTYANHKEHAREHGRGHGMQDCEQRAGHGPDERKAHEEVRDALLDDGRCYDDGASNLGILSLRGGNDLEPRLINRQGIRVDRGLVNPGVSVRRSRPECCEVPT